MVRDAAIGFSRITFNQHKNMKIYFTTQHLARPEVKREILRVTQLNQDYHRICDRINKSRDLYEVRDLGYKSQEMIRELVALGELPESAL